MALVAGLKIAYVFFLHFMADWALQSKEMGRQKSNKFTVLLAHAGIHFLVFFFGGLLIFNPMNALLFSAANAAVHGLVDWYLWRFYKISVYFRRHKLIPAEKYEEWGITPKDMSYQEYKQAFKDQANIPDTEEMDYLRNEFKFWDDYWFGFMLGFDQLLHAATLAMIIAAFIL